MYRVTSVALIVLCLLLAPWAGTVAGAADKVVSYKGNNYNVANVTKIASRVDGTAGENQIVGLRSIEKKEFQAYVKEHGSVVVTTVILFDEDEMVYQNVRIKKYKDLENTIKQLDKAMGEITKFMGRKKGGVLKLK